MISPKDTADIRRKMLTIWKLVDEKKITTSEARLHIGIARTILETIKVEIAAAHLNQANLDPVPIVHESFIPQQKGRA
jgi:hypothetical protein